VSLSEEQEKSARRERERQTKREREIKARREREGARECVRDVHVHVHV
jgi:hypothetical protein